MASGLDKDKRLADKRAKAANEAAKVPPLNPRFPFRAIPMPWAFFQIPANPKKNAK